MVIIFQSYDKTGPTRVRIQTNEERVECDPVTTIRRSIERLYDIIVLLKYCLSRIFTHNPLANSPCDIGIWQMNNIRTIIVGDCIDA